MIKFVFDLDGTITSAETLPIIAKTFNVHNELAQLTKDTVAGKIPWKHSFIRRVGLLKHIPVDEIDKLLKETPLYPQITNFIKNNLEDSCIATGNLDCWVDGLCHKVGCEYYSSKAVVQDNQVVDISIVLEKAHIVDKLKSEGHTVVFVGDSNNDVNAMRKADISIAFGASHEPSAYCLSAADHIIYSEEKLVGLLNSIIDSRDGTV